MPSHKLTNHQGRTRGATSKAALLFKQKYDLLIAKGGKDPIDVLSNLLNNRTPMVRLAAAKELLSYRYPKQAHAQIEIETQGQLVINWDKTTDTKAEPIDITPDKLPTD